MSEIANASNTLRLTQAMIAAMAGETARAAGAETALVSITLDVLGEGAPGHTRVDITRATKSLVFSAGEIEDEAGRRLLAATAVHKILRRQAGEKG